MKIVLDTNAYTRFCQGHAALTTLVQDAEGIVFSVIVAGELLSGFRTGKRFLENRRLLRDFLSMPHVIALPVTFDTADWFGRIAARLHAKGKPIPVNDVWIAAQAMESGAELITFDRHFDEIDGLALVQLG